MRIADWPERLFCNPQTYNSQLNKNGFIRIQQTADQYFGGCRLENVQRRLQPDVK